MKIKLKSSGAGDTSSSVPSTPIAETPTVHTPALGAKPRIKFKTSQPPTPATESTPALAPLAAPLGPPPTKPLKRAYVKKPKPDGPADGSNKRTALDDIAPTPKRPTLSLSTSSSRRPSIKQEADDHDLHVPTPTSTGGPKLSLKRKLQQQQPDRRDSTKRITFKQKRAAPPKRPVGVGYDSEASDAEEDPLIESQFVLRMQPGQDCDYLRDAIANKTLGEPRHNGGADVSLKFLDKDMRRVIINIRGRNYAAAMVDLPCVIESMKSWDKRGWWKVVDICQMMLVLGPTENDDTARLHPLPKDVDKNNWAYAHGLTPPMHYVRKRRFRKRASYKTVEHIDEEVERLLKADAEATSSSYKIVDDAVDDDADADADAAPEDEYEDENDPDNYIRTTENGYGEYDYTQEPEEDDMDLERDLEAALEMGEDADSALPVADAAASLGAVETAIIQGAQEASSVDTPLPALSTNISSSSTAPTPHAPAGPEAESEDDDDDDDDDESSDEDEDFTAIDEDLVAREAELEGQRQDIEELEKRIAQAKADIQSQKNPLLKQRKMKTLKDLEDELEVKKKAIGMGDDDDD
ncbi:TAFII55 protein conserved region-domain-containing protein [Delphinella strobiligena]|nr:TAFII55 protein conserved region-domain-containing protein [Delphinella strobiligena]